MSHYKIGGYKFIRHKINLTHKRNCQGNGKSHPASPLIIKQNYDKRKNNVKDKYYTQSPSDTNYIQCVIWKKTKQHRKLNKTLIECFQVTIDYTIQYNQQCKKRNGLFISSCVELIQVAFSCLHFLIIAIAHTKTADYHKKINQIVK